MNFSYVPSINATQAYIFRLQGKNVSSVCITLRHFYNKEAWSPAFLLQLSVASSLTTACKLLLKPFVQASIVGQIMGGIMGGPSALGHNLNVIKLVFPFKSLYILETLASFGCILFVFLVGVKTDLSVIKRTGKKEWKIGVSAFIFPIIAGIPACFFVKRNLGIEQELESMLINFSFLAASSSFQGIACFLDDLKLLNSELGRIALSSSMISGIISYVALSIITVRSKTDGGYEQIVSAISLIMVILFPLRSLLIWIIKRTPEREIVKESYLGFVVLLVLGSAFAGELIGLHALVGPTLLGLVLPDGSVLAASLIEKVEAFVTFVILPLYFISCGLFTDLPNINSGAYFALQFLALLGFSAKFVGVTLVSVFLCGFASNDAIILGLMLSTIGVLDIQYYRRSFELGLIDYRCFGVLITSGMIITGLISFIVKALYDPFARYIAHERHTIQHFSNNLEFRILACIHSQEYVPSIINLLEVTNPTRESPICVYVLHLVELAGRASPLFVHQSLETHYPHQDDHLYSLFKPSENIINAFRIFERNNKSLVTFQAFTAISPRATMHNDVCMLSVDKRIRLIIIPFHIKWSDSGIATESPEYRSVNLKLIDKAPCSVGILIDRGSKGGPRSFHGSWCTCRVGVFFIGGPDDREAVSYATRMAKHPHVTVTVMRLIALLETVDHNTEEKKLDSVTISNFRQINVTRDTAVYKEETLVDSEETCHFFRSIENAFDLILVGRRTESPLLLGLSEWKEYPELGLIGDLMASQDFKGKVSILVVQQHIVESRIILEKTNQEEDLLLHQNSTTALGRYDSRSD